MLYTRCSRSKEPVTFPIREISIKIVFSTLSLLAHAVITNNQSDQETRRKDKQVCSARDWDDKDYLRIIPRVVW